MAGPFSSFFSPCREDTTFSIIKQILQCSVCMCVRIVVVVAQMDRCRAIAIDWEKNRFVRLSVRCSLLCDTLTNASIFIFTQRNHEKCPLCRRPYLIRPLACQSIYSDLFRLLKCWYWGKHVRNGWDITVMRIGARHRVYEEQSVNTRSASKYTINILFSPEKGE